MLAVHLLYSDGDPEDNIPEQMKAPQEKEWAGKLYHQYLLIRILRFSFFRTHLFLGQDLFDCVQFGLKVSVLRDGSIGRSVFRRIDLRGIEHDGGYLFSV
jgi:hypothetical protein